MRKWLSKLLFFSPDVPYLRNGLSYRDGTWVVGNGGEGAFKTAWLSPIVFCLSYQISRVSKMYRYVTWVVGIGEDRPKTADIESYFSQWISHILKMGRRIVMGLGLLLMTREWGLKIKVSSLFNLGYLVNVSPLTSLA